LELPSSLKSSLHVPVVWKLTIPAEIEHIADAEESTVITTASPEVAVAVGV
jgi:hypothetical protein